MRLLSRLQALKNQTMQSPCAFQSEKAEECDSGMASDEENPEMQLHALQEAMQRFNIEQLMKNGSKAPSSLTTTTTWQPSCWMPHTSFSTASHSIGPLQISLTSDCSQPRLADLRQSLDSTAGSDQESLLESSDYDQASLDLELDSSLEFEQKWLGQQRQQQAKSRRDMSVYKPCRPSKAGQECVGASDDEVSELLENLPHVPVGHTARRRHSSGALARQRVNHDSTSTSTVLRRKRHFSDGSRDATVMHRPCLDFEKMQKNVLRKPVPHGVNKVRIVKVKTFNGASVIKPTPVRCDPALFSFQPIVRSGSPAGTALAVASHSQQSTPVEDSSRQAF